MMDETKGELKDRSEEITQSTAQTKADGKCEREMNGQGGQSQGPCKRRERWGGWAIFKEIVAKHFPELPEGMPP